MLISKLKLTALTRGIIILLVSIYLLFSIGILKATHFCMGREASVSLFTTESAKCACSLFAGEKDSCCDDEHSLVRLENEQKVVSNFSLALPHWFLLQDLSSVQLSITERSDATHPVIAADASPPPKIPLWKMECRLLFYDDEELMG